MYKDLDLISSTREKRELLSWIKELKVMQRTGIRPHIPQSEVYNKSHIVQRSDIIQITSEYFSVKLG
jgi:hypothetical protein